MPPIGPGPVPTNYAGAIIATMAKAWREKERQSFLSKLGYIGNPNADVNTAIKDPDASKASGVVAMFGSKDFKANMALGYGQANRVVIPWVDRKRGEPKTGDARLSGSGTVNRDTMEMGYDWFFDEDQTQGKRSSNNLGVDDIMQLVARQQDYVIRALEEAFVAQLAGTTSISTTTGLAREVWGYNQPTIPSTILQNPIRDFATAAGNLFYAANLTSRAAVAANDGAILTAQEVMRLETQARTAKDPAKPLQGERYVGFACAQGMEQLKADGQLIESQALSGKDPIAKLSVGQIGSTLILPMDLLPSPAANVGRFILCGEGAALMAMVERPEFKQGDLDRHGLRKAASFTCAAGFAVPYFDANDGLGAIRRGSFCLEHYARTLT